MDFQEHQPNAFRTLRATQELAQIHLESNRSVRFVVTTDSMTPVLHRGDRIVVQTISPDELRIGDLVLTRIGPIQRVHRLVAIESRGDASTFVSRGDNSRMVDGAWHAADLLGLAIGFSRGGCRTSLRSRRARFAGAVVGRVASIGWTLRQLPDGRVRPHLEQICYLLLRVSARLVSNLR